MLSCIRENYILTSDEEFSRTRRSSMSPRPKKQYFVYILKCRDGSYYTGYTSNVDRRVQEHNSGIGGRYTRMRLPAQLVHTERFQTRKEAIKRELAIKKLSRRAKRKLIKEHETGEPKK